MVRLVLGLLVVAVLVAVLLRTMSEQPASVPKDVQGEIKAVPAAKAQQVVPEQLKQIEQQNRARLDRATQEAGK